MQKVKFLLVALLALVFGCSKDSDTPVNPQADKIVITVLATYPATMNVINNKLILSVSGQADLSYIVPPGQNYVITISGDEATMRKGKTAVLAMSCTATNNQGASWPVCYNFADGKNTIASLSADNGKIEWIGDFCGTTGDQIVLHIKTSFQYAYPEEYKISFGGLALYVSGTANLGWNLSATADTTIILSGEEAANRIGKSFSLEVVYFA